MQGSSHTYPRNRVSHSDASPVGKSPLPTPSPPSSPPVKDILLALSGLRWRNSIYINLAIINYIILGVRSLANASRARQFNPLNPPGVGWVPLPQTNMAAVFGRARSCAVVRGRACVVGRAWSCAVVRGRARSCVVVRGRACVVCHSWSCVAVRGRAWSVVRGRAWSCGRAVLPASRPARFAASTAVARTNERTNEQHLITH